MLLVEVSVTPARPQEWKPEDAASPVLSTALRPVGCYEAGWNLNQGVTVADACFRTIPCGRVTCCDWCSTKSVFDLQFSVSAAKKNMKHYVWFKLASPTTLKRLSTNYMKLSARGLRPIDFLHRDWQRRWARWWGGPPLAGVSVARVLHRPTRKTRSPKMRRHRG